MENKVRKISACVILALWLCVSLVCVFKPQNDVSVSERRKLAKRPELSAENLLDGKYMADFESFALDQFPARDNLRTLKALSTFYVFRKSDNNGIYISDGYASKLEYPMSSASVNKAADKLTKIYEDYLKGKANKVYLCVVPDKNYFLAGKNGYPSMDYGEMTGIMKDKLDFAEYIDIFPELDITDYYKTDTHWRQEYIIGAADKISAALGNGALKNYTVKDAGVPFYGVYYGQSALPLDAERINYVSNDVIDNVKVTNVENSKTYTGCIDEEKLSSNDPYEIFLSGASAVINIENPSGNPDKKLVVFRDSFGSSMTPLIIGDYGSAVLVDTRYISSTLLDRFVDFENADVLFLYSTLILNQSESMK